MSKLCCQIVFFVKMIAQNREISIQALGLLERDPVVAELDRVIKPDKTAVLLPQNFLHELVFFGIPRRTCGSDDTS